MKLYNLEVNGNKGFTLLEILIVIVIIGILAAVAVPMYTRHITAAKAQEANLKIAATIEYIRSYTIAHSGQIATLSDCSTSDSDNWLNELLGGDDSCYFTYTFENDLNTPDGLPIPTIYVYANTVSNSAPADTPFTNQDQITVTVDRTNGQVASWEGGGRLKDVSPTVDYSNGSVVNLGDGGVAQD